MPRNVFSIAGLPLVEVEHAEWSMTQPAPWKLPAARLKLRLATPLRKPVIDLPPVAEFLFGVPHLALMRYVGHIEAWSEDDLVIALNGVEPCGFEGTAPALQKCPDCNGAGTIALFTSCGPCTTCNGSGNDDRLS
jgi:hypothetical protein